MTYTVDTPFQALTLAGGGFRGLFTARALQVMEEHIHQPIGSRFDLISGTSIGGFIAIAIAFEVPMAEVVKVFEDCGALIFPGRSAPTSKAGKLLDLWRYGRKARYSVVPLREALSKIIDKDALLGDAKHALAIPAVNVTTGAPQVFKTRHRTDFTRDWQFKALDVALATSAAPTYFPLAEVGGNLYADGGIFANSPDLIAIHEAEHFLNVPDDAIRLLSVGTTSQKYSISFSAGRDLGVMDWIGAGRLFSTAISAQQQFVHMLALHRLGARYLHLDHEPSDEQAKDLGLDIATPAARKTLLGLAEKAATDVIATTLAPFLRHTPQLRILAAP